MRHVKLSTLTTTFLKHVGISASLLLISAAALALPSDRSQPISLVADRATFNEKSGTTTYSGNVIIEQGSMKVQAASIVAQLNKDKQISVITATGGPAKFQQQIDQNRGISRGEAQKIVYNAETGLINLIGNAYFYQDGGASIRSNTLTYSLNKGDIEAAGSSSGNTKRVQIIIPPSNTKTYPGVRN